MARARASAERKAPRTRKRKPTARPRRPRNLDPVTRYAYDVVDGKVVAGRLVRLACERHLRDLADGKARGLVWRPDLADRAIGFFSFLKHSKGEWAGTTVVLEPWQRFIVGSLFGWLRVVRDHRGRPTKEVVRRFRDAYNEIARKNGKSTLAAGILLYLMIADGEAGAEVYCAATKKDQARIVWSEADRMVKASPALRSRVKGYKTALVIEGTASKLEALGADEDTLDGLNIHGVGVDELHAHKSRGLLDVLETATGARRQPVIFKITTAGYDRHSVCWQERDRAVAMLEGRIEADDLFAYVATIDEGDDWADERVWEKANPNLGVSVKLDDLRSKCRKAQQSPAAQNGFKRLHLNVWTEQSERWLDGEAWDACGGAVDDDAIEDRRPIAGLDMSATTDITSACYIWPPREAGDPFRARWRFWLPSEGLAEREKRDRVPYRLWAQQGYLTLTDGNVVDYDVVRRDINDDAERYGGFVEVAVDPWNATQLSTQLQSDGHTVVNVRQGFATLAAPTKEIERLVLEKSLLHGGNPIARWMAGNVSVKQDPAGNMKPDKVKSPQRIDGIVALVTGLARALVVKDKGSSIYETEEITFL